MLHPESGFDSYGTLFKYTKTQKDNNDIQNMDYGFFKVYT